MSKTTRKDNQWWIRKHLRGTEVFIDCEACPRHGVVYQEWNRGLADRSCTTLNKNLNYWGISNAPNWCPRRKRNGGKE